MPTTPFKRILIISDMEGSSLCFSYRASSGRTRDWYRACLGMTADVRHVVDGLFAAGVKTVVVKDFHRTGYNIVPELIHPGARIISGYKSGPIPGIGNPVAAEAVMFLGMHAASGTAGFLPHTLTSRIARLEVNGKPMSEVELFSASLAPYGLRPIFFSGCPVACRQAEAAIKMIQVYPIHKDIDFKRFDAAAWRAGLRQAAVKALQNEATKTYLPKGPFTAKIVMRDGDGIARKLAKRWGFHWQKNTICVHAADMHGLYHDLIRLCYLTPLMERMMPFWLPVYDLWGRMGLFRVRRELKARQKIKSNYDVI